MSLIKPTRRDILKIAAAMPAFALPAALAKASVAPLGAPAAGNGGVFRFSMGDMQLSVLSDGFFSVPTTGLGVNAPRQEVQAFLAAHYLSPEEGYSHTNHLLIETAGAKVQSTPSVAKLLTAPATNWSISGLT